MLKPGDVLLYSGEGFVSSLIKIKTWSDFSHVEIYDGDFHSVASRDGIGVGRYPLRLDQLRIVLRPAGRRLHLDIARAYFESVNGRKYDWIGLLSFTAAKWQRRFDGNHRMFCSEFATNYLRAGGLDPFNGYPASGIAPGEFMKSAMFTTAWRLLDREVDRVETSA